MPAPPALELEPFEKRVQRDVVLGHLAVGDSPEYIRELYRECPSMEMSVVEQALEETSSRGGL